MPPQGTSSRAAPRVASHRGPGVLYIPCFLGPVQGKIRLTCHPNGGLLLVFRVTRAFAASRDPPPLLAGRIETENSPSFKLERYAGIPVNEGSGGQWRKDIHFHAHRAACRLRLPCRAHDAASSQARRRHPQHALGADWITLCHPQLASSDNPSQLAPPLLGIAILLSAWNRFSGHAGKSGIFVSRRVTSPGISCKSRPIRIRAFLLFEEWSETLISHNEFWLD
jgi:hypothetical protein